MNSTSSYRRPTRAEAEAAVRTLLAWAGDDPNRALLRETPQRVVEAYGEYFRGYREDPASFFTEPFPTEFLTDPGQGEATQSGICSEGDSEAEGEGDNSSSQRTVLLKFIPFYAHCLHHLIPFIGTAHIAYAPGPRLVGLSKIVRVLEAYARRLQTQEHLTSEVASALEKGLQPRGLAVVLKAEHQCMALRGVEKGGVQVVTTHFSGVFREDFSLQTQLLSL